MPKLDVGNAAFGFGLQSDFGWIRDCLQIRMSDTGHRWSPKEESPPKSPLVNPTLKQRSLRFNQDLAAWYIFRDWPHMMQAKNQQALRSSELKHFRLSLSLSLWILEGQQVGDESISMFALRVYDVKHALNQYLNIPISIINMSTYGLYACPSVSFARMLNWAPPTEARPGPRPLKMWVQGYKWRKIHL